MKNLAFHTLPRWKTIILSIIHTTSLIHFSLKGWENVLFELGSERVNSWREANFTLFTLTVVQLVYQHIVIAALLHPKFFARFPRIPFPETTVIMKSSVKYQTSLPTQSDYCAFCTQSFLHASIFRNYKITNERLSCVKELVQNVSLWSIAMHYGCKRAGRCGSIANGRSQADRDFSCVRNVNCCFSRCAANVRTRRFENNWKTKGVIWEWDVTSVFSNMSPSRTFPVQA